MAKVTLSKEAQRDIIAIRNYIRDELCNPSAAKHIIACLKKSIQSLEKFSGRGRPLDALLSVHTEYRYLVCENYCIFYLEDNEQVIIVRILHQRQDSLRALFLEKSGASLSIPRETPHDITPYFSTFVSRIRTFAPLR